MDQDEVVDAPRFGALRTSPPEAVLRSLGRSSGGTTWTATPLGEAGGYPNGGIWRVVDADQDAYGSAVVVKRTGPRHLGTSPVWRNHADPGDPQWWGREAEFYLSDLATVGWTDRARAAHCHVDDHDGCRDLWLEDVDDIPADLDTCLRAVTGLAHWQTSHGAVDHPWLSSHWIASHVGRHALDNERTLAHPAWPEVVDRGVDPALRDQVARRVTDPARVTAALAAFPQALTNHDFHSHNIGTVGDAAVIID